VTKSTFCYNFQSHPDSPPQPRAPNSAKARHPNARRKTNFSAPAKAGKVSRMKESHDQGSANQIDPESCVAAREGVGEALTGANAGRLFSPESVAVPDADAHWSARKATSTVSPARETEESGGASEPAHASKHLAGSWEISCPAGIVNLGPHRQSFNKEHRDDERA